MSEVTSLFVKTEKGAYSKELTELHLVRGLGIADDINADIKSPRQVLLIDSDILAEFGLHPGSLKENITMKGFDLNNLKSGSVISIGDEVKLRITFDCEPCSFVKDQGVSNLSKIIGKRGKLAVVLQGGVIGLNDALILESEGNYSIVPSNFTERFNWVLNQIPRSKVLTYSDLLKVVGGASSYMRAFPNLLKRARNLGLPSHRVLDSKGNLIEQHLGQQRVDLLSEGIEIEDDSIINLSNYLWDSKDVYFKEI